jgi:acetyl-CoA acetyltransferase
MGEYADYTATKAGISRKDQDEFAYQSHRKAVAAQEAGAFDKGDRERRDPRRSGPTIVSRDESAKDTSIEGTARLKPAFVKDNTAQRRACAGSTTARALVDEPEFARTLHHPDGTHHCVRHWRRGTGTFLRRSSRCKIMKKAGTSIARTTDRGEWGRSPRQAQQMAGHWAGTGTGST